MTFPIVVTTEFQLTTKPQIMVKNFTLQYHSDLMPVVDKLLKHVQTTHGVQSPYGSYTSLGLLFDATESI